MILNRKSPDVFKDVAEFTELAQPDMLVPLGQVPSQKAMELAVKLVEEECNREYIPALKKFMEFPSKENLIGVIDGGMDTIYAIAWALRILNAPSQAMWNEVQRSNMAKFPLVNHKNIDEMTAQPALVHPLDLPEYKDVPVEYNTRKDRFVLTNADTGKVMKPKGWTPPNLHAVLEEFETVERMRNQPDMVGTTLLLEYFHFQEGRKEKGEIEL